MGWSGPGFDTIVASRTSHRPARHATPGQWALARGDTWCSSISGARSTGCVYLTRTVVLGEPDHKCARAYSAVREAVEAAEGRRGGSGVRWMERRASCSPGSPPTAFTSTAPGTGGSKCTRPPHRAGQQQRRRRLPRVPSRTRNWWPAIHNRTGVLARVGRYPDRGRFRPDRAGAADAGSAPAELRLDGRRQKARGDDESRRTAANSRHGDRPRPPRSSSWRSRISSCASDARGPNLRRRSRRGPRGPAGGPSVVAASGACRAGGLQVPTAVSPPQAPGAAEPQLLPQTPESGLSSRLPLSAPSTALRSPETARSSTSARRWEGAGALHHRGDEVDEREESNRKRPVKSSRSSWRTASRCRRAAVRHENPLSPET